MIVVFVDCDDAFVVVVDDDDDDDDDSFSKWNTGDCRSIVQWRKHYQL